jgi:D-alanine-D-alanine ligase
VVAFDKSFCKIIAQSVGIPVVPFVTFAVGDENIHNGSFSFTIDDARAAAEEKFGYPMFVKPCRQGSSFGADVINDRSEFFAKVKSAAEYGGRAIIEKYMKGVRELECAYAEYNGATVLTSPGYVEYGGRFYDYHSKYEDSVGTRLCPAANVDADISQMIRSYSRLLAGVLGVRGISRIDFFLADGEVYFNEINTIPGLTSASLYPMMLDECGVGFDKVIMGLVNSLCREAGL